MLTHSPLEHMHAALGGGTELLDGVEVTLTQLARYGTESSLAAAVDGFLAGKAARRAGGCCCCRPIRRRAPTGCSTTPSTSASSATPPRRRR